MDDFKDKKSLVQKYFDILEKDEKLKDKDFNYIKFIKDFGINDNFKKNIYINKNFQKDLLFSKKKNKSSLNICEIPLQKRKFSEYKVTFYHPGTY